MGKDSHMTKILRSDPYMEFYAAHKQVHPEDTIMLRQFRKADVDAVDRLVERSRGRDMVKTADDWELLNEVIAFYTQRWPHEWEEFKNTMLDIRGTRGKGGYSESRDTVYLAAIPLRLERLIKSIFPQNQWNKQFANKFAKRFSRGFKVAGVGNAGEGRAML